MSLCVAQETYTNNGSNKYALKFDGMPPHTYIFRMWENLGVKKIGKFGK